MRYIVIFNNFVLLVDVRHIFIQMALQANQTMIIIKSVTWQEIKYR